MVSSSKDTLIISWNTDMKFLRTPDDCFADLEGYAFSPHYHIFVLLIMAEMREIHCILSV